MKQKLNLKPESISLKVHQDYNIIADKFRETRKKITWIDLQPFLKIIKPKSAVLDVGCGTGRIYGKLKDKKIDYLGIDYVDRFLTQAKQDYPKAKFLSCDISQTKDWRKIKKKYDVILCVAVLHHFPTPQNQQFVLNQMKKRLKKDGFLILTVWNLWRKKFNRLHFKQLFWKIWQGFKFKWLLVPFKISDGKKTITQVNRFMYCFTNQELLNLMEKSGFKIIKKKKGNNLCFLAKKR